MTPAGRHGPPIERLGEDALLLRLGESLDLATNTEVHACAGALAATRPAWVRDIVPAYATLAVFVDVDAMRESADPLAAAEAWISSICGSRHGGESGCAKSFAAMAAPTPPSLAFPPRATRTIDIPVRFGGEDGPDLAAVADAAGLSDADTISRFCAPLYQVAMLGFAPGFPYLLGLDPALEMPRLETPRLRVPAGSVAIGGAQAGIYPREGPGGWRLLGRTSRGLFDAERDPPALVAPGDRVRFVVAR